MLTGPAEGGGSKEEGGEEDQLSAVAHVGGTGRRGREGRLGEREGGGKVWARLGFIHGVDAWQEENATPYVG